MCVCVLNHECFAFFLLLRDVFESLICWLDLCLSSLLVAFISMCFSSLWKTQFLQARQLLERSLIDLHLSSSSFFFSRQKLEQFQSIELSRICLDSFSIHRETFYLANRFSTASQCIEVLLPSTDPRQHLDRFTSVRIYYSTDLNSFSIHQAMFFYICLRRDLVFIFSLLSQ